MSPVADAAHDADRRGGIAPEDSFLVQVRSGSRVAEQAISGRIEHLHSGRSESFGSLAELIDFLARHFSEASAARGMSHPEVKT
jgi:hypothetical protein